MNLENTYGPYLLPLMDWPRDLETIRELPGLIHANRIPLHGVARDGKSGGELIAGIDSEIDPIVKHAVLVK